MKNLYRSGLFTLLLFSIVSAKAQVPVMSSYPSASSVIFLDFDGQTVVNTSWNFNGPIYAGPSGLSNGQIVSAFNRVAEDYRPFNVNVTTDSTKYWAAPANRRMRVIITVTSDWYGSAGGVSYVGSFTWGDNTPCFVFSALLALNEKYVAEAASHEAGHTLGLYHQSSYNASCVKTAEYNPGTGSGEIGWAPIMGVGYYKNFTLWNNGPNSYGCSVFQSDLSVITGSNGFSFRGDDFAATFAGAYNLTSSQFTVNGVVEQNSDMDMFKYTQPANGRFLLNATPYNIGTGNVGSDLDMQVTLYNSSQTLLNVYNPGTLLNSIIDTTLNAGTYYLKIEGRGNANAPNYASLGSYALSGGYMPSTLPLRRLELQGELLAERHRLNWIIDADEQVIEQVLEISRDGRSFSPVITPATGDRTFTYTPMIASAVQYRLKVTFDNNRTYYSNIVTLRNTGNDIRPKLMGNSVSSQILVSSPGNFEWSVYDLNGKMTGRGQLVKGMNSLPAGSITPGMYLIRFNDNSNQWTDKFVRQQ